MDEIWHRLSPNEEEEVAIIVTEDKLVEKLKKWSNSLMGKLHVERTISKDILQNTMKKICKTHYPINF